MYTLGCVDTVDTEEMSWKHPWCCDNTHWCYFRTGLFCGGMAPIPISTLCDGVDDCGPAGGSSGQDEVLVLCDSELHNGLAILHFVSSLFFSHLDKCRLPYYGGCDYTRICSSSVFDANCGSCLPGYFELPVRQIHCARKFLIYQQLIRCIASY